MISASPPDRWRAPLWWKQFLPVTRRRYVLYLCELGAADVQLERADGRVALRVRHRDVTGTTADALQDDLLRGDLPAAARGVAKSIHRRRE